MSGFLPRIGVPSIVRCWLSPHPHEMGSHGALFWPCVDPVLASVASEPKAPSEAVPVEAGRTGNEPDYEDGNA